MAHALLLLASASREEELVFWLDRHGRSLAGLPLLATAELARRLRELVPAGDLPLAELPALADGGDIMAAARVLAGEVVAVIAFADPCEPPGSTPDPALLLRACDLAGVPLALNAASADLALRGLAHGRMAYLLFNPVAGQGDPNADLALIRSILEPQLLITVLLTRPDLDPAEQTRELVDILQARPAGDPGDVMIVACGGDGTVSAVAGAVADTGIVLGVIPRGTANAFAAALGIPTDLIGACDTILAGHTHVVDAARCNDVPMILLAGLGFEAGMVDRATRELKTMLGPIAYVLAGAQQLVAQQPFQARVEIDGALTVVQAAAITVANVAPATSVLAQGFGQVIPDDGLLEVTIASPTTRLQGFNALASLLASAVVQSPTTHPDLLCLRARQITITTDPPQKLVIDGEMLEADPVTFTCLPGALTVFAPLPLP
ncbi:lipid kinase [Synechococcus sp. J7-Johnson]|uniref:diacylglycerol kinase family protein n=1 Tax=Synechococcus sp. J7-Johnson TaxID=2823737 RepID=UPI0020CD2E41|nr:diacylglycerol kinase family protein [Synechococcus sp. J7-Johnson]MCP9839209.1 lipid kinase [Synechococcus sp. J7-Johnson]